jgi:hypothetical protein
VTATLDDRLRELARATHAQIEPSPGLFSRISEATEERPAHIRVLRRPLAVAAAAGIAAAIVVGVGVVARAPGRRTPAEVQVGSQRVTRQEWISQVNRGCQQGVGPFSQAQVVFPTARAYSVAAAVMIPMAQPMTGPFPPDAAPLVAAVNADLHDALVQLEAVRARAAAGDVTGATSAYDAANADFNEASAALVAYGATAC